MLKVISVMSALAGFSLVAAVGSAAPSEYTLAFEVKSVEGKELWSDRFKCNIAERCEKRGKVMIDGQPRELVVKSFYFGLDTLKVNLVAGNALWKPKEGAWAYPVDADIPLSSGAQKTLGLNVPEPGAKSSWKAISKATVTVKVTY